MALRIYVKGEYGNGVYASFVPKDKNNLMNSVLRGVPGNFIESYQEDQEAKNEGGPANHIIHLYSLEVEAINKAHKAEVEKHHQGKGMKWAMAAATVAETENTCTCNEYIRRLLIAGAAQDLLRYTERFTRTPWPQNTYTERLKRNIHAIHLRTKERSRLVSAYNSLQLVYRSDTRGLPTNILNFCVLFGIPTYLLAASGLGAAIFAASYWFQNCIFHSPQ